MLPKRLFIFTLLFILITCAFTQVVSAQNNLARGVSFQVNKIKIADLLNEIGKRGGFFFSYSSDMVYTDSVVTLDVSDKPLRQLLDELFQQAVAYKEAPGYIILRPAPNRLKLIPEATDDVESNFNISGYILDDDTGAPVRYASVYDNRLLISTLTDETGFFKIKIRSVNGVTLTVSKEMYRDTSVNFLHNVTISQKHKDYVYSADTSDHKLERSWLGRVLISSSLRLQSMNIGEFISNVPVQTSLVPGWGNHGLMSGQIVNKFSLNALGGYSAGVDGVELGGLYNLNKGDVHYLQAAGLFNAIGGTFGGLQMAGIYNRVYKDVNGVQVAGLFNVNGGSTKGIQLAGLTNQSGRSAIGLQITGLINRSGSSSGVHIAGLANLMTHKASGLLVAGLVNKARVIAGVNIAAVSIADSLNGAAINVVSFSGNGYHQLHVATDDNFITTISFKSGNAKLYSRIIAGINMLETDKYYTYGFAFGHDFLFKKGHSLSTELSWQSLVAGKWNNSHQLNRFSAFLNVPITNKVGVFFGLSLSLYDVARDNTVVEEHAVVKNKLALTGIGTDFKGWIGWTLGLSLF